MPAIVGYQAPAVKRALPVRLHYVPGDDIDPFSLRMENPSKLGSQDFHHELRMKYPGMRCFTTPVVYRALYRSALNGPGTMTSILLRQSRRLCLPY